MKYTLEEISEFISDGTHSSPIRTEIGIPVLSAQNINHGAISIQTNRYTSIEEYEKFIKRLCIKKGDILLTIVGSIGRSAVVNELPPAVFQRSVAVIRPKKDIAHSSFINHIFGSKYFQSELKRNSNQSSQAGVYLGRLGKIKINLPSLDEQKRIAKILDRANKNITLANLHQVKAKDLIQSIFAETFTQSNLFNSGWPIQKLSEVVKQGTIITYGIVQAGDEYPGGVPYIRTGDINNNEINLNGIRHTSPAIASRFKRSTVSEDEIVMSIRATVGTTALVPKVLDGANLTQGTARIAPGEKVTTEYLLNFLRSPKTQHWIRRQVKGATFREITLTRLRELPVVIPPILMQREFSKKVKKYNDHLIKIANFRNSLTEFYQSLESDLINSAK